VDYLIADRLHMTVRRFRRETTVREAWTWLVLMKVEADARREAHERASRGR
jgi:hypothetical protein